MCKIDSINNVNNETPTNENVTAIVILIARPRGNAIINRKRK
jgi:hypothetical protein